MGALGRRRTFIIAPFGKHIELPTDLRGLSIEKYDNNLSNHSLKEVSHRIILAMQKEWHKMQKKGLELAKNKSLTDQHYAVKSLLTFTYKLLNIANALPKKAIAGLHDQSSFEASKQEVIMQVRNLSDSWEEFAILINLKNEYSSLLNFVISSIEAIPFYRNLKIVNEPDIRIRDLPILKRIFRSAEKKQWKSDVQDFLWRLHLKNSSITGMLKKWDGHEELKTDQQTKQVLKLISIGLDQWWSEIGTELTGRIIDFQKSLTEKLHILIYSHAKG